MLNVPRSALLSAIALACAFPLRAEETVRVSFFAIGDPQYLAEKAAEPKKLDPYSEEANARFIRLLSDLRGAPIPGRLGGGTVAREIRGVIVAGDLIDSLDKRGGHYPAMQRFEWERFQADYGLRGGDGKIPFPVYELHGNHDGPQGDTFLIREIVRRNERRPAVVGVSANGLHYSWDWGPLHLVNLGIFVGEGETRRKDHHYAPRASLEFLRADLKAHVGESRRPVIVSHHLHLTTNDYDWPDEDRAAYFAVLSRYNVIAIFNGHTHGSPPRHTRWDGKKVGPKIDGIDNFDPDDAAAAKLHQGKPVGLAHGLLYCELVDAPGTDHDRFVVRSYKTRDNWKSAQWDQAWSQPVSLPPRAAIPRRKTGTKTLTPAQIYQRAKDAAVEVLVDDHLEGSGCFVSAEGLIATAAHVIGDPGRRVEVLTAQAGRRDAQVVAVDAGHDVALLRVRGGGTFPFLAPSREPLVPGQRLYQFGTPIFRHAVMQPGAVAREDATFEYYGNRRHYVRIVHVAATLQAGTSGGPWLNRRGELAGVQSGVMSVNGAPRGISFLAPVSAVRALIATKRHAGTPSLRAAIEETWQQPRKHRKRFPPRTEGLVVKVLPSGGAAARAGVKQGDLIVAADGRPVRLPDELLRLVRAKRPGEKVKLQLRRPDDKGEYEAAVTLERLEAKWHAHARDRAKQKAVKD